MTFNKGLLFDHRKCPCCWDPAGGKGCGFADCMPFSFVSGGVAPGLDGEYETCVSNELPDWCEPSFEPVNGRLYATAVQVANGCGFVFAQYCRVNEMGHRGRSWVAEYWCSAAGTGSGTGTGTGTSDVKHLMFEALDWECRCEGARFSGTFEGATVESYGCCADGNDPLVDVPCCDVPIPETLLLHIGGVVNLSTELYYGGVFTDPAFPLVSSVHYWTGIMVGPAGNCAYFRLRCQTQTGTPASGFTLQSCCNTGDTEPCEGVWEELIATSPCAFNNSTSARTQPTSCDPFSLAVFINSTGFFTCLRGSSVSGNVPVAITAP